MPLPRLFRCPTPRWELPPEQTLFSWISPVFFEHFRLSPPNQPVPLSTRMIAGLRLLIPLNPHARLQTHTLRSRWCVTFSSFFFPSAALLSPLTSNFEFWALALFRRLDLHPTIFQLFRRVPLLTHFGGTLKVFPGRLPENARPLPIFSSDFFFDEVRLNRQTFPFFVQLLLLRPLGRRVFSCLFFFFSSFQAITVLFVLGWGVFGFFCFGLTSHVVTVLQILYASLLRPLRVGEDFIFLFYDRGRGRGSVLPLVFPSANPRHPLPRGLL